MFKKITEPFVTDEIASNEDKFSSEPALDRNYRWSKEEDNNQVTSRW